MDTKTKGIVATIASVVLCGCPGLFVCFGGAISAVVSQTPNATIDIMGSSDPNMALAAGIGSVCGGLILILIPVAVGFFTLRNAKA